MKEIKIPTRTIVISILIAFLATFVGGWALGRFQRDNASRSIIQGLNDVMRTYVYTIGDLQKSAWEKDAIITTQRQAIREGLLIREELRKLKIKHLSEVTHLQTTVEILLDSISHTGTIIISPCPPEEDEHPVLYLPLTFQEKNKFLDLRGEFDENAKLSMEIKLPINIDMWVGWDKSTKRLKGIATIDNPYVHVQNITTIKTDLRRPSKWGVGIVIGYGVGYVNKELKVTPFVGGGLSRSFARF